MEKYRHIHIAVFSTAKTAKEKDKYQQLGALNYLVKPSTFEEYIQVAAEIKRRASF